MSPVHDLTELARTAEEVGFDSSRCPTRCSTWNSSRSTTRTPRTGRGCGTRDALGRPADRGRLDGAVTSTLRFYTNVMKLGLAQSGAAGPPGRVGGESDRQPVRLRRRDRLGARGIRVVRGQPYAKRGARVDEMIEVIKLLLDGGWSNSTASSTISTGCR